MSLCGSLGIEFDPTSINFWNRDLHYIGGNHSVKRLSPNKHFYQKIVVDERWRDHLTDIAAEKIDQDVETSIKSENVEVKDEQLNLFENECEGQCGI